MALTLLGGALGTSCIIPDHGIVALVDCGSRWCATAEFAEALDEFNTTVQVQEPQPGGSSGWVTECVCMTPAEDLILRAGDPPMQYELLRNQIIDATRQACLDAAIASGFDPDPPWPLDELLEPSCYEAPATDSATTADSADTTAAPDSSTGEMASLAPSAMA